MTTWKIQELQGLELGYGGVRVATMETDTATLEVEIRLGIPIVYLIVYLGG